MTKETKLPAIPNSTDPSVKALKEALEVRLGRRGDPLDRAATIRELYNGGVISVTGLPSVSVGGGRVGGVGGLIPTVNNSTLNMSVPQAPTNLTANGAFVGILLTWDRPVRRDLTTHIYRSDDDDLATAVFVGLSPGHIYSDLVGHGKTHYYWVRYVSEANITGPYNAIAGTLGRTAIPVSQIISELNDVLDASHLSTTLQTEIEKISLNGTSITDEVSARIAADGVITTAHGITVGSLNTLTTTVTDDDTGLSATAEKVTALQTALIDPDTGASLSASAIHTLTTAVTNDDTGLTATAGKVTALETALTDPVTGETRTAAAIDTLFTTVNDAETGIAALATATRGLETVIEGGDGVVGLRSSVEQSATSVNGLRSEYTVKIDNSGKVTGYGLASGAGCLINGLFDDSVVQANCSGAGGVWTESAEFAVNVDTFRISSPSGDLTPFQVVTGAGMCILNNGTTDMGVAEDVCLRNPDYRQWVPAGVYMTQASMISAYIDGAHINNLTLDLGNVTGTLSGNKIDFTHVTSGTIIADIALVSPIITAGSITSASLYSSDIYGANIDGGTITGVLVRSGAVALLTDHGNPHYAYDSGVASDVSGSGTSGITSAQLNIRPFNFHQTEPPVPHVKNPASNLWRYRPQYITPEVSGSVALTHIGGLINSNHHANIRHCQIQIAIKQSPYGAITSVATFDITSFNSGDDATKTRVLTAYTGYYNYTLSYQYRTETGMDVLTNYYYHRIESQTLTFTATPRAQGVSFNESTSAGYYAEVQVLNVDGNFCSVGNRTIRIQDTADNAY